MPANADQLDVRAQAQAAIAALGDLQGYLSAAVNPDRIALADLEMEPMGWTRRVYSKKAFEVWQAQLRLFPDDPLILHHLAIMHHARAFDTEADARPAESDKDWETALSYWHRLHGMDAFWDQLTAKACAGTTRQDSVKKLRADFPRMILAVHYDIALDKDTREKRKSRAKFHIGLAQRAPFDSHDRAEAQRAAYNNFVRSVPDEVWQSDELREEVLNKGQQTIIEYLKFDPGCIPALEDALRLQRRILRSRHTHWRSVNEDDPKRLTILRLEKKDADAWRPYFDQLVAMVEQLDQEVRDDLARWYRGRASALVALDDRERAITFYEQGLRACGDESDDQRDCGREMVQTMADLAREKASKQDAGARAYCDRLRDRADLTIIACWLLAQAYAELRAFDVALAVCDRGLAIEPDFDDVDGDEWLGRLRNLKTEFRILELLVSADSALAAENYPGALTSLDAADRLVPPDSRGHRGRLYWLRTQTYLALERVADARQDAERFKRLLNNQSSKAEIEAAERLNTMVATQERLGNIKTLMESAEKAMKAGKFQESLTPLDEAARRAPQLTSVFSMRAQALCAVGRFADAQRDLKALAALAKTADDRNHVRELETLVAETQAVAQIKPLLDRARSAMERQRFDEALKPLDEAARKAPERWVIYFMRSQARMATQDFGGAMEDTKKCAALASSPQEIEATEKLRKAMFGDFGDLLR